MSSIAHAFGGIVFVILATLYLAAISYAMIWMQSFDVYKVLPFLGYILILWLAVWGFVEVRKRIA